MIRACIAADIPAIFAIVNDAARAYKGVIPADRWHEPYMPVEELENEMAAGVRFLGYESGGELVGVMGIQDRGEVDLIRHAYVRASQRKGGSAPLFSASSKRAARSRSSSAPGRPPPGPSASTRRMATACCPARRPYFS